MKVLVTGATGFLGSHVVEVLLKEGHEARALVRKTSDTTHLESLGVEHVVASLETGDGLDEALDGVGAVVHSAGLVKARNPGEFHEVNAHGTENLVAAARRKKRLQRFVYISSLEAHGPSPDGKPRPADAEPHPVTHYGKSKLAGEDAVRAAKDDLPVTILRPTGIYGPRDREMLAFFKSVKRRVAPIVGGADSRVTLVYGPDAARAVYKALVMPHASGRTYFVEDGRVYSLEEMGKIAMGVLKVRALQVPLPSAVLKGAAIATELYGKATRQAVMLTRDKLHMLTAPYLVCSAADLREELGWKPEVDFTEGAQRTVDWYRENGWL